MRGFTKILRKFVLCQHLMDPCHNLNKYENNENIAVQELAQILYKRYTNRDYGLSILDSIAFFKKYNFGLKVLNINFGLKIHIKILFLGILDKKITFI